MNTPDQTSPSPLRVADLFDPEPMRRSGADWRLEAFTRAYTGLADLPAVDTLKRGVPGPFDRVLSRLKLGYSILVRLPGNCMLPAARLTRKEVGGDWEEHGRPTIEEGSAKQSFGQIWEGTTSILKRLLSFVKEPRGTEPRAIFHNLDLLANEQHGLLLMEPALTAFCVLQELTRSGVVLGFSDRDASELPARLQQIFPETIELDAIDEDRFLNLVPQSLGRWLPGAGDCVNEAALRLVAARLRFLDPIRAVRMMEEAADTASRSNAADKPTQILKELWRTTQTLRYVIPSESLPQSPIAGFEPETESDLTQLVGRYHELRNACLSADGMAEARDGSLANLFSTLEKGVLLHGPAGTGKTHLARWLALQLDLPLRIVVASQIRRADWGRAEELVHALFREARRVAPCVLVVDEADDLLPDRDQAAGSVASAERAVVDAALQELDGVFGPLNGVLVIMTTNREHALDKAVRSRLSRNVHVPYPILLDQVKTLVDAFAAEMGLDLSRQVVPEEAWCRFRPKQAGHAMSVRDLLAERFFGPLQFPGKLNPDDPKQRRDATDGLFSAREIRLAMGRLIGPGPRGPGGFPVTQADLERLFLYYARQRQSAPC